MEIDPIGPVVVHALRWSPGSQETQALPELAGSSIFDIDANLGRETVSEMVTNHKAIAGINADFFPWTGDPIGMMMRNGELLSRPYKERSFVAWGNGKSIFTSSGFSAKLRFSDQEFVVAGWNEENPENCITMNTEVAGYAKSKIPATMVVVEIDSQTEGKSSLVTGRVINVLHGATSMPIPESSAIIVATGPDALKLDALASGTDISVGWNLARTELSTMEQAIAGGPILLQQGKIDPNWQAEGFNESFALRRHPRTAVGRTASGYLWFVAIDGRSDLSVGATLEETARILLRLGCTDGLNLDGGGSTTLNIQGVTVNRPSDGKERPVANGILFYGTPGEPDKSELKILGPEAVNLGETKGLAVQSGKDDPVSASEVIWAADGAAWIDQGGYLRPVKEGKVTVRASFRGKTTSRTFSISKSK